MTLNIEEEVVTDFNFDMEETARLVMEEVLQAERFPYECEVSLLITDDRGIHSLNKKHRGVDAPTDVLSFPMIEYQEPGYILEESDDLYNPETGELMLGDIVISKDKVSQQAILYNHSPKREFAFLMAHSMLHLLGYDHMDDDERETMEEKQERILQTLGITREETIDEASLKKNIRDTFKDKKRIVIKIGSALLSHKETGRLDLIRMEKLVRQICDIRSSGKDVVLVTSGAIMVGVAALSLGHMPENLTQKQACASVGQARLMMIYQKLFSEYNQVCSQILLTKNNMLDPLHRYNAKNTLRELLNLGAIPIVNENDTVATYEIDNLSVFGDNDTLSAVVASLVDADLLVLLSDIEGLYTDNPHKNKNAKFIETVEEINEDLLKMGKDTDKDSFGTGGMATKLSAARIAVSAGCDMVIAKGEDFGIINEILKGEHRGTLFTAQEKNEDYCLNLIEHL